MPALVWWEKAGFQVEGPSLPTLLQDLKKVWGEIGPYLLCCGSNARVFWGGRLWQSRNQPWECVPSWLINISDSLQASDCYSQEVTVWVGLHRWRPFLVNIHIKISLGALLVSFLPPSPHSSSLLIPLVYCGETLVGLFSFYWCGDNTFICLQDSFFFFFCERSHPLATAADDDFTFHNAL